jgi:uncharacterized phosphosugar-binding protein
MDTALERYLHAAQAILKRISDTQGPALEEAAQLCAASIGAGGLVHLFGTGHSRIPIEEIFPRHGSFPGFHPIVELSMTFHTQVVGANGQRQAMLIEKMAGLGQAIMKNFIFQPRDTFMIFSNSGVNQVIMEVALEAKAQGMKVIGVVSLDHCQRSRPKHPSGQRLIDVCDLVLDNCVAAGDALVKVEGLAYPVGPGSSLGFVMLANALKCRVAELLTQQGQPPLVLTSSVLIGDDASADLFERTYNDYRARVAQVYGG